MIQRQDIQHAIAAIASRDTEVGFALADMLQSGRIDILPDDAATAGLGFLFAGERLAVHRHQLFHHGAESLTEPLLRKYGELLAQQTGQVATGEQSWAERGKTVRRGGLEFLLDHLLAHELKTIGGDQTATGPSTIEPCVTTWGPQALIHVLQRLQDRSEDLLPWDVSDPAVIYRGVVNVDTPALFVRLPLQRETFLQAAERDLEFFSLRLLLDRLARDGAASVFACLVRQKLVGLMLLEPRRERSGASLEVRYIATVAGRSSQALLGDLPPPRGVGALLLAGAWLLWRRDWPGLRSLRLTAELGAIPFYEQLGWRRRRTCEYVLHEPQGRMARNLVAMAAACDDLPSRVLGDLIRVVTRQARRCAELTPAAPEERRRSAAAFCAEGFRSRQRPELALAICRQLVRHGGGRPFAEGLLTAAAPYGWVQRKTTAIAPDRAPVLVVSDERYGTHLAGIMSFEGSQRQRACAEILANEDLAQHWRRIAPRHATSRELCRVHTAGYVQTMAGTVGQELTALDRNTQTNAGSFETACLAVGGVLNLLDELMQGPSRRGFAFVRPPGHHAEAHRAGGYCLFNNVALGARHLLDRHGLSRVMIVDIDAHHGNGTQHVFYDTDRVLFISTHRGAQYPWTGTLDEVGRDAGAGYTVNVPLPGRCRDRDLVRVLADLVRPVAEQYAPEAMLISCGFDLYEHDPLCDMCVTPLGYALATRLLCRMADDLCDGRIAFVLEGGYSTTGLRECGLMVMRELCDMGPDLGALERSLAQPGAVPRYLALVLKQQARFWSLQDAAVPTGRSSNGGGVSA